jgi:high-affinity nickel-transport protein
MKKYIKQALLPLFLSLVLSIILVIVFSLMGGNSLSSATQIGFGGIIAGAGAGAVTSGSAAVLVGAGLTAYLLGIRHAFDADHIAAIDNTVRRISLEKRDSSLVGLFFSLGQSTVVLVAGIAMALGFSFVAELLNDDSSVLKSTGAIIGGLTAGSFLVLIAIINILFLIKLFKNKADNGKSPVGILSTIFSPILKNVDRSWKMYPLGLLFGLGFDTATSIALLALAGGAVVSTGQSLAVLALPIIFMAGMALGDTIDSILMSKAYNYATDIKKRRAYTLFITILSIFAALIVGLPISLNSLGSLTRLDIPLFNVTGIEYENLGVVLAVGFISTWLIVLTYHSIKNKRSAESNRLLEDSK